MSRRTPCTLCHAIKTTHKHQQTSIITRDWWEQRKDTLFLHLIYWFLDLIYEQPIDKCAHSAAYMGYNLWSDNLTTYSSVTNYFPLSGLGNLSKNLKENFARILGTNTFFWFGPLFHTVAWMLLSIEEPKKGGLQPLFYTVEWTPLSKEEDI